jgi:hypothetical protein
MYDPLQSCTVPTVNVLIVIIIFHIGFSNYCKQKIEKQSVHVGFVVDKVAEFFGFTCQYHSTVALHTNISSG